MINVLLGFLHCGLAFHSMVCMMITVLNAYLLRETRDDVITLLAVGELSRLCLHPDIRERAANIKIVANESIELN